jgi:hypothetical protein
MIIKKSKITKFIVIFNLIIDINYQLQFYYNENKK